MLDLRLEIDDFLGFCDLNGVEAMQTEQVQRLEAYIRKCKEAMNEGNSLVSDAIWDKLMQLLCAVNPESELCKYIWEVSGDELDVMDDLVAKYPLYSIQTVKSFDCVELGQYVERLPEGVSFDAHVSVKLLGRGIRLLYKNGEFVQARSQVKASAGRDITQQLRYILYESGVDVIDDLSEFDFCEVRGEWVLPFCNMAEARRHKSEIKSPLSGVSLLGSAEATEEEWGLLHFVAYEFIAEGMTFQTKQEEYDYLESLGFTVPLFWVVPDLTRNGLVEDLKEIVSDCEAAVKSDESGVNVYDYYTDGLVFTLDNYSLFYSLGADGSHYNYGNIVLKMGYWNQTVYQGFVQTILWVPGKTKLLPVAIVGESPDMISFVDGDEHLYIMDVMELRPGVWDMLGVGLADGVRVHRVPLYEPANILMLDAYPGNVLSFHYAGALGVVPCFEDGTPLLEGYVRQMLEQDIVEAVEL